MHLFDSEFTIFLQSQTATTVNESIQLVKNNQFNIDNVWVLISSFLVFLMHLGFAMLETGLTRSKNSINVLFKNSLTPALGVIIFALCGYGIMYPGDSNGIFGFSGLGIGEEGHPENLTHSTFFLFQALFAATAATIVSGAVAERIKLSAYIVYILLLIAIVYPMIGSWVWGGGWLSKLGDSGIGFYDFAGASVVHVVGGAAALAGVALVGPRLGKFNGKLVLPLPGHNMSSATMGAFLIWFGWIGFNGGSTYNAEASEISQVILITILGGAAGAITSNFTVLTITKKYDLSMVLNGILGGLVSVTAGANYMNELQALAVGAIAGIIVVPSIYLFEKLKLDDPVGAISVHLVCGLWGTLAVGIFSEIGSTQQLLVQLIGALACALTSFVLSVIIFLLLKATVGIRVMKEQELTGLDLTEHGSKAYSFVSK